MNRRHFVALLAAVLAGCRFPKDTGGTLDRVEGGTLRIGILGDPDMLGPAERDSLQALALSFDASPELVRGTAHDLVAALEGGRIDLLAGDIPKDTPLASTMALSRPWGQIVIDGERTDAVFGIRKGEHAMLLAVDQALGVR